MVSSDKKIKLILADDHQLVRKGLRMLLDEVDMIEVIGEAVNGKEVIALLRNGLKPDVVLLDYEMPLMNGLETAGVINTEFFGVKTIMLTMFQNKELIQVAVAKGIKGFLFKNASIDELTSAIQSVFNGESYFTNEVTMALLRPVDSPDSGMLAQLSDREIEILKLVAQGKSSTDISRQLFISPRTVDTHRNNIIQKLGVPGIAGLTQFALRNKLI